MNFWRRINLSYLLVTNTKCNLQIKKTRRKLDDIMVLDSYGHRVKMSEYNISIL